MTTVDSGFISLAPSLSSSICILYGSQNNLLKTQLLFSKLFSGFLTVSKALHYFKILYHGVFVGRHSLKCCCFSGVTRQTFIYQSVSSWRDIIFTSVILRGHGKLCKWVRKLILKSLSPPPMRRALIHRQQSTPESPGICALDSAHSWKPPGGRESAGAPGKMTGI